MSAPASAAPAASPPRAAADAPAVTAVPVPTGSLAAGLLPRVDFADAWAAILPPGAGRDPRAWARAVFVFPPRWVTAALRLRNAVVAPLGLRTPRSAATGFPEIARDEREVVLGLDDRHLDFRVSVMVDERPDGGAALVVSTFVRLRNAAGRAYFAPVRLVHGPIVRAMVGRAVAP